MSAEKKKVVAVVGARLNSSRLPGKHLLDLAGKPVIQHIFDRLATVPEIDEAVLATTADDYNAPLVQWAKAAGNNVLAYEGDVNDLMGRVDAVVIKHKADIVVYVCGDCPLIEPSCFTRLLQGILADPSADCVDTRPPTSGRVNIHEGFSIFSAPFWKKLLENSKLAEEREHVGSAKIMSSDNVKRLLLEPEPSIFSEVEHRISVDTPSDYEFMKRVYARWYETHSSDEIVSLSWVIEQLLADPDLRAINGQVQQKEVGIEYPSVLLVTEAGQNKGLGHLRRVVTVARGLQDLAKSKVHILAVGEAIQTDWIELLPQSWVDDYVAMLSFISYHADGFGTIVFDVKDSDDLNTQLLPVLKRLRQDGHRTIAIDCLTACAADLDLIWSPCFYVAPETLESVGDEKLSFGWGNYLLPKLPTVHLSNQPRSVLVMLGGGDVDGFGQTLPQLLDQQLPVGTSVHWVQGPFASAPRTVGVQNLDWRTHVSPPNIYELYAKTDVAICAYGVSLFELLCAGVPLVAVKTSAGPGDTEWAAFQNEKVSLCVDTLQDGAAQLAALLGDANRCKELSARSRAKLDGQGVSRFVDVVKDLVRD